MLTVGVSKLIARRGRDTCHAPSLYQHSQDLYLTLHQLRARRYRRLDRLRARVARVLRPVHIWLAGLLRHHRDAALHRAGDLAQIAADALLLDDLIRAHDGRVDQLRDRLVRRVFAGDITAAALDAVVLVDLGDDLVIHVQVFPVRRIWHGLAGKFADVLVALFVHPARQAVLHLFDDAEAVQHRGGTDLNRAAAQSDELRRVAPVADAADAGNRQAFGGGVAGDFGHHVQRDRLDGRAAIAAVRAGVADHRIGDHAVQVQVRDRVDGVDQRDRVGAAVLGRARRRPHVGDVGRELDDDRQLRVRLAPARDHLDILRHLADGRAHAAFRHAVRAAEIELDAIRAGGFDQRQNIGPQFFFARQHQRDDDGAVRPIFFHLRDFTQIDFQRTIGNQLDVIEAEDFAVFAVMRRVARRDVDGGRVFTQRLPHHAAPAGLEGAHHVVGLVGRRRGGQPERIRRFDAAKIDGQISHYAASSFI